MALAVTPLPFSYWPTPTSTGDRRLWTGHRLETLEGPPLELQIVQIEVTGILGSHVDDASGCIALQDLQQFLGEQKITEHVRGKGQLDAIGAQYFGKGAAVAGIIISAHRGGGFATESPSELADRSWPEVSTSIMIGFIEPGRRVISAAVLVSSLEIATTEDELRAKRR